MVVKKLSTVAPKISALSLGHVTDGDDSLLESHGSVESSRYDGIDVGGSDLAGISFTECELIGVSAHDTNFRSADFIDTRFERLNAPIFTAPRSRFRDVVVDSSRIGSAEFYETSWQSVHFINCKLGFINLRGAQLQDVLFTNCTIDELDLGGASANRVSFVGTQVNNLDVTQSRLQNVDLRDLEMRQLSGLEGLRGATVNSYQLTELAPLFASQFGIKVED